MARRKVLLIGWGAADWEHINPGVEEERLRWLYVSFKIDLAFLVFVISVYENPSRDEVCFFFRDQMACLRHRWSRERIRRFSKRGG